MTILEREKELESQIKEAIKRYLGARTKIRHTKIIYNSAESFMQYITNNPATSGLPASKVDIVVLYEMFLERLNEAVETVERLKMDGNIIKANTGDLQAIFRQVKPHMLRVSTVLLPGTVNEARLIIKNAINIMAILARNEILALIRRGIIKIEPFNKSQIGAGSIDMHLDDVFRVFRKPHTTFHVKDEADYKNITQVIKTGGKPLEIMPGELVTGITRETLKLPNSIAGWIEGRSRFARIGLMTHLSSGYIHPGTTNRTVLEIANMSPMPLAIYPGTKICQIVLEEVRGDSPYRGRFHRQRRP